MSSESRRTSPPPPRPLARLRDAAVGALIALPAAVVVSQVEPEPYRSGAAAIAFLVVLGLAVRWTVALGAGPVLWLGMVAQVSDDLTERPLGRDVAGLVVWAVSFGVVLLALRRWEGDRRHARDEATARWRNERRLRALVELAHRLASVGSRPALFDAVGDAVPLAAGSTGAIVVARDGDRVEFPAVWGHDPGLFPAQLTEIGDGTPAADVLRSGRPVFCPSAGELLGRYPMLAPFVERSRQQAWAALPIPDVGVLVLTWRDEQVFSPAQQAFLETIANLFGAAAERIRVVERAQLERFVAAFDAMLDGVGIHRAIRDPAGRIVDFQIEYLNPAAVGRPQRRVELTGARMTEVWPENPALAAYADVVESGVPFVLDEVDVAVLADPSSDAETVSIRASRLDEERMVLVVRDVSERARLVRQVREANEMFAAAQELAHVGSWKYDFVTDRLDWSAELYRIVGVPEGAEPVRPVDGSLFGFEHPDDRGKVVAIMRRAIATRAPFTFDMRIVRQNDGEVRDVSTTGTFRTDDDGTPTAVWGATQDVTTRRRAERARRAALAALADQRQAVAALQNVILPASLPEIPGAALSAQYRAATSSDAVGGDWYDAFAAPDGQVAIVIGDVAGHGVECAAVANELRVSVRVRVRDGMAPGEILAGLDAEVEDGFVTCWLASYDPTTRSLRVANAGHPPAVLIRGGGAEQVTGYTAPPLGTQTGRPVGETVLQLEPGDLLVLYTDGLVEQRGQDLADGIARLEHFAARVVGIADPARVLVDDLAPDAADDVCVVTLRVG